MVTRERSGGCFNEQFSSLFVNWGTKDYVNVGLLPREEKIKQSSRPCIVIFSPQGLRFSSSLELFIIKATFILFIQEKQVLY